MTCIFIQNCEHTSKLIQVTKKFMFFCAEIIMENVKKSSYRQHPPPLSILPPLIFLKSIKFSVAINYTIMNSRIYSMMKFSHSRLSHSTDHSI